MNSILSQELDLTNEDFFDQIISPPLPPSFTSLNSVTSMGKDVDDSVQALYNELTETIQCSGEAFNRHLHLPQDGRAQPRQRARARRGQATDPHSISERLRRERIAERMRALQELVLPNASKTDKASMLEGIIDYVKFLQLQVNRTRASMSTLINSDSATETQVAKLMDEDMGSAMQYLQGKGLCLMPVFLATAISTCRNSIPSNNDV